MRPAFLHYLVQTRAADPYPQAHCDAPAQALAPAAIPETENTMPAPLAGNAVTDTRDQAAAPGTRAPAPVTPGHRPRKTRALLPRRAARRAQTAPPATARSDRAGNARAQIRGGRLQRVAGLLRQVPKTRGSYHDPLFERPDLIEDDYYRLRNQPRG
jgi:hypothetical protein